MRELYLLLGSNLGDRRSYIDEALAALEKVFGAPRRSSPIIETEACGFEGPAFLNMVTVYESAMKPEDALAACKSIERSMGRTDAPEFAPDGSRIYHDRTIDIDILLFGDIEMDMPLLKIPHPQVLGRPFVRLLLDAVRP